MKESYSLEEDKKLVSKFESEDSDLVLPECPHCGCFVSLFATTNNTWVCDSRRGGCNSRISDQYEVTLPDDLSPEEAEILNAVSRYRRYENGEFTY